MHARRTQQTGIIDDPANRALGVRFPRRRLWRAGELFRRAPQHIHALAGRVTIGFVATLLPALGWGDSAVAKPAPSSQWSAEEHAKVCHCGIKCRQHSCCCGRRQPAASPENGEARRPSERPIRRVDGPCMGSAPCGGEGLPTSSARPLGKPAALALHGTLKSTILPGFVRVSSVRRPPTESIPPPDEPPEHHSGC
jgi:hypothetical protein